MLLKIYKTNKLDFGTHGYSHEELHIIDRCEEVVVHQGNYGLPPSEIGNGIRDLQSLCNINNWGPTPQSPIHLEIGAYCNDDPSVSVRVIDYKRDGVSHQALIERLCYVCNDQGKTIERVECYSGARLSL